ncbi:MAG: type V CRISPR-associated endonuclease Cas1 [bacterium]|nr:type V CRISPR-associated endonuclease Cas1 [bacterium]
MISLPDFKEKQVLIVRSDWKTPSHLAIYNDNIVFKQNGKVINRISLHKTFAVFVCGDLTLTTAFFKKAKEHGISIFLLRHNLEMYAGLATTAEGHYVLRMRQYDMSPENELQMAKRLVANKIKSQTSLLLRRSTGEAREMFRSRLACALQSIDRVETAEELRGIEGNYAREYFAEHFSKVAWRRRAPRTKEDINNLLLDLGYTMLFNFVDSILRLHGFDTYKGFYHKLFFQRRSLACDVMEPLRPIVDATVLKMQNLNQVTRDDFKVSQGAFLLPFENYPKCARIFLDALMAHKEDIFIYIQSFYRHVMDPARYEFPEFNLHSL